jgi:serine/threonine protein kinase
VKRIYLQNARKEVVDSIEKEIKLLRILKHENIVQFVGVKRTEREINIFMELFEPPGSLKNFIENMNNQQKKKSFTPEEVQQYALQVITSFAYLLISSGGNWTQVLTREQHCS